MKTTKMFIAAAALSGLIAGTAARAATPPAHSGKQSSIQKATDAGQRALSLAEKDTGKHDCKGKNACKGQGGCKTGDNGCKAKNTCKGHGGCKTQEEKKLLVQR
jgi:hypothetical protein